MHIKFFLISANISFMIMGFCLKAAETVQGETGLKVDRYLKRAAESGWAGSVLAAQNGKIILAKGYDLADRENKIAETAETVFSVGSITKQFTAAAILKLEMMGKLSVSDSICKHFADVPEDKKGITLHHLLTHTAGFTDALGDDYDPVAREAFIKLALSSKLLFKPGERYEYSNVGYSLLGIITEMVSGKGYESFLYETLFLPAGMEHTGYLRPRFGKSNLAVGYRNDQRWGTAMDRPWMNDGPGWHLRANGGILSTVGDMYRWYLALQGEEVLSAAAKKGYFTPHIKEYAEGNSYYGYGWVVQKTRHNTTLIWHNGGNGIYNAFMGWEPEKDFVVIVSSNIAGKISDDYARRIREIIGGTAVELSEDLRRQYSGVYRLPSGAALSAAFDENDNLVAEFTTGELVALLCTSGAEKKETTSPFEQKVRALLSGIRAGDYSALARAWGEPLEAVAKRASAYWQTMQSRLGKFQNFEILGTVSRPRHFLTYARLDFTGKSMYLTYVWQEGRLIEVRESPSLKRVYEAAAEREFREPALGRMVRLETDGQGQPLLTITGPGGSTRAFKTGSASAATGYRSRLPE